MAALGYSAKLKRGLGLAFGWLVSMSHIISFSRYQT